MQFEDRRTFLKTAALSTAALTVPTYSYGKVGEGSIIKGRKVNVAAIGCGSKGAGDIYACKDENVVALCDVDWRFVSEKNDWGPNPLKQFPGAKLYNDYRKMLREMGDKIDAVTISTPDHMHFPPAMMAIEMGKHVFVQKPLTHTIEEARLLTAAARKHGVITVMGNQGHCSEGIRLAKEWFQQGFLGDVREVHIWHRTPEWKQGFKKMPPPEEAPKHFDWNLWLGVAPKRPFSHGYHPNTWRAWWDFGTGALGDMGCHMFDASYWALELGYPTSVVAEARGGSHLSGPVRSKVTFEFPARGKMPPVTLKWYAGGNKPPRPEGISQQRWKEREWGQYWVGSKATLYDSSERCTSPRIIPEDMAERPKTTIARVPGGRPQLEWLRAIKGEGPKPGSNFDYSGPLTETVLLGNVAVRTPGVRIKWDAVAMNCTNSQKANALVRKKYRKF
ncbi:hypothetical protein BVX94_00130 [bacterium B17]|nr:hypothetical protein BVX94_00130 [bacterium B17]